MMKVFLMGISGLLVGLLLGLFLVIALPLLQTNINSPTFINPLSWHKHQIIGFLPYWLLGNVKSNSTDYITTLTYFGLRVQNDGTIMHETNPGESEPGWLALTSGKLDGFFQKAKHTNVSLSLLVSSGDIDAINQLVQTPILHADTLVSQVSPLLYHYGFSDLNLDIEDVQDASPEARVDFAQFLSEVKKDLGKQKHHVTLTVEISPADLIHPRIISLSQIAQSADTVVLMAYDYHYSGSLVTGPVAPLFGAGDSLEYDTNTAVAKALHILPPSKLVLGVPMYGYEWDSLDNAPQSAVIPGSGVVASNNRAETFLVNCATCSGVFDQTTKESHIIYNAGGYFDQTFYPDSTSMQAKITYAENNSLSGLALWALGYDGSSILQPLLSYK